MDTCTCLRVAQVDRHTPDIMCSLQCICHVYTHTTHTHSSYAPLYTVLPPVDPTGLYRPPHTPPDLLCISHTHVCTTRMPPWECMCTPHTHAHPATRIDVPTHAYTRIHHVHTHHICACLGEPRPHTRYPPTFPTPFTHANPCVPTHQLPSPHSFPGHTGSVWVRVCLHITWGIWTHGPPSWTLTDHTDSCHTSPRSVHPALTLLAAPPGVVSLWGWWGAMVC